MPSHLSVAGELITDHIFDFSNADPVESGQLTSDAVYLGTRGGGTAANIAVGVAARSTTPVAFVGDVGADRAGTVATEDLLGSHVDVRGVTAVKGKRTRLIFENWSRGGIGGKVRGTAYSFSGMCPVCGQRDPTASRRGPNLHQAADGAGWAVIDRLATERMRWISESRAAGRSTAVDLGAVDYLRFLPITRAMSWLSGFDLVNLSGSVAASLMRRAGVKTPERLAALFRVPVLVVGYGPQGSAVVEYRGRRPVLRSIAAPRVPVVDDAGCGDAFLADLLACLPDRLGDADVVAAAQKATARLPEVLSTVGARGHLDRSTQLQIAATQWDDNVGRTTGQLRMLGTNLGHCPVCELPMRPYPARADSTDGSELDTRPTRSSRSRSACQGSSSKPAPTTGPMEAAVDRPRVTPRRLGSRSALARLVERTLHVAENQAAIDAARQVTERSGTAYVVGSGGSFPSASYIATLLSNRTELFAQAIRPADYLAVGSRSDVVIAVSYSGRTPDLLKVAQHAKQLGVEQLVALTGAHRSPLEHETRPMTADLTITYGAPGLARSIKGRQVRERGFVSIAGTVMPCVPFAAAITGRPGMIELAQAFETPTDALTDSIHELAFVAQRRGGLNVIGGGWGWSAMLDLESKFTEADLGDISLHEWKDLSHGRFISVLGSGRRGRHERPALLVGFEGSDYQAAVEDVLRVSRRPVFRVDATTTDGPIRGLELLFRAQLVAQAFGQALGVDISRPEHIPGDGLRLYRFQGPIP